MYLHDKIPVLVRHVLEADVAENASIVDEDVNPAESLDGSLNDSIAILHAVVVCNGLSPCSFDFVDNDIGSLCVISPRALARIEAVWTFVDWPSPLNEPPRSLTTTFAPLEPKNVAYAFPKPPPAPVMTTVWPSNRNSDIAKCSYSKRSKNGYAK